MEDSPMHRFQAYYRHNGKRVVLLEVDAPSIEDAKASIRKQLPKEQLIRWIACCCPILPL